MTKITVVLFKMLQRLVSLLFFISLIRTYDTYVIPNPEFVVYQPSGFTVSIPNEPGIKLFAFHANINKELRNLHPGQFSKDIVQCQNDKWIFSEHHTKLKVGDVINYWLFVVKDGLGFRLDNGRFVVKELTDNSTQSNAHKNKIAMAVDQENEVYNEVDNTCFQSIYNVTQSLIQLQTQYEEIKKENLLMRDVFERMPNAKQLTLSGKIPPDGPPINTASFILREKLNLNPAINTAQRNLDGSITFEVSSIEEKFKVLNVSKQKLLLTKILIQ